MKKKYVYIEWTEKFKYLGECTHGNEQVEHTNMARVRKLELACKVTRDIYNKRTSPYEAKIKHAKTQKKAKRRYGK